MDFNTALYYIVEWFILFFFYFFIFWPVSEREEAVLEQKGINATIVIVLRMAIVATLSLSIMHMVIYP